MSEAMNVFMNSYLKKMRRPEMSGGFTPDQAFGANLVHGSESLNPDSLRDRTNAQFGSMKSPLQQGPSANIPGIGGVQNVPFMGGNKNTPFADMMTRTAKVTVPNAVSPWLTEKLKNMLREKPTEAFADTMRGVEASKGIEDVLKPTQFNTESGLGGYEKVGESFGSDIPKPSEAVSSGSMLEGFDPNSLAITGVAAAAPKLLEMLSGSKTAGNVTGAATSTGLAAAQGFTNPISDLAAVYSLYKLIRGIF